MRKTARTAAGPLTDREGEILVDPRRCPALHRALQAAARARAKARAGWVRVAELRAKGRQEEADALVRRLLGVQEKKEPMTPERRAAVREYERTHKDEILAKRRRRRALRRALAGAGRRGR